MRLSRTHINTLREVPGEAEIPSHIWLLRSGMIRRTVSGVYGFMTLGLRVLRKIENIIREEMDAAGAQEIITSPVQPAELWHESGRWQVYGPELWRMSDRHGREFCLGPTAEEIFTDIVRSEVTSYRQLPLNLYQIQTKYRDEARPRYGLMRSREFVMKDAYSFDRDQDGLDASYALMRDAYTEIFTRCGLDFRTVAADSGAIGGNASEEFTALCEYGESDIAYCESCSMAATVEHADSPQPESSEEAMLPAEAVSTPGTKTIDSLALFLGIPKEKTLKALLFEIYEDSENYPVSEYIAVFIRGDRELNEVKLRNALGGVAEHLIAFADETAMSEATGAVGGFTGPVGLKNCRIIVDSEVPGLRNLCSGANKADTHTVNINYGRDFTADMVADLRLVQEGDPCPVCGAPLKTARGIEVGQVFKLGTKYSESMGAVYKDESQEDRLVVMGCYGIGVTRTMAAIAEQNRDDKGPIWPMSVAPYHAIITLVRPGDSVQSELAECLYSELNAIGVETVLDDRDERPGVKFNDADIFGIPIRITVGKKAADGLVEYKLRRNADIQELTVAEVVTRAGALLAEEG